MHVNQFSLFLGKTIQVKVSRFIMMYEDRQGMSKQRLVSLKGQDGDLGLGSGHRHWFGEDRNLNSVQQDMQKAKFGLKYDHK